MSFVAYPGGHLYVDGTLAGIDSTAPMTLAPGRHTIRVVNRFLGDKEISVDLQPAQTGAVPVEW